MKRNPLVGAQVRLDALLGWMQAASLFSEKDVGVLFLKYEAKLLGSRTFFLSRSPRRCGLETKLCQFIQRLSFVLWSFLSWQALIKKFELRKLSGAQHQTYALGIKEVCMSKWNFAISEALQNIPSYAVLGLGLVGLGG